MHMGITTVCNFNLVLPSSFFSRKSHLSKLSNNQVGFIPSPNQGFKAKTAISMSENPGKRILENLLFRGFSLCIREKVSILKRLLLFLPVAYAVCWFPLYFYLLIFRLLICMKCMTLYTKLKLWALRWRMETWLSWFCISRERGWGERNEWYYGFWEGMKRQIFKPPRFGSLFKEV